MKSLGVKWLISASAVGSLKREIKPLDVVIPDQFIDRTHNRPISFFGGGALLIFLWLILFVKIKSNNL